MDWITQNKYIKWLIGILLLVNLVTITIIWILIMGRKEPPPFNDSNRPPGTVEMMKKELNLSDDQVKQFEKFRTENFEKTKLMFDQLDNLKRLLSEELTKDIIDTALINSISNKIGFTFAKLEKQRIEHFNDLISICTAEQKPKLRAILKQLVGGKPPENMPANGMGPNGGPMPRDGMDNQMMPPPPHGSGNPPKQFDKPGF